MHNKVTSIIIEYLVDNIGTVLQTHARGKPPIGCPPQHSQGSPVEPGGDPALLSPCAFFFPRVTQVGMRSCKQQKLIIVTLFRQMTGRERVGTSAFGPLDIFFISFPFLSSFFSSSLFFFLFFLPLPLAFVFPEDDRIPTLNVS